VQLEENDTTILPTPKGLNTKIIEKMGTLCYLNNRFLPYSEAHLHISDLGLQRGYSIFDYFLEIDGRTPFINDYLDRFYTSAELLHLTVPLNRDLLKEKIAYLLEQNKLRTSGIKLLLTGGYSEDLYTPSTPNFMILNKPVKEIPGERETGRPGDGEKLLLLDYKRHLPEVKTTFYLPSIALFTEMKAKGAIEVLYHHNGLILETTRANFFLIKKGVLITPGSGVLRGITRKYVLKVVKDMMPVEERDVQLEELLECDEAFITGTSKHVMPIIDVDGKMIGNGRPGEGTKEISAEFERFFALQ
jgi:branched-subunit amino acid aminotransferase/4-amino-4-deoxychorismate lyase